MEVIQKKIKDETDEMGVKSSDLDAMFENMIQETNDK